MKQQLTPILLPTDKASSIYIHAELGLKYSKEPFLNGITNTTNQILFLVSDEEINESEIDTNHCIFKSSNGIITCLAGKNLGRVKTIGSYYKIIATTDSEFKLPKIPQDFIQYFVEKQGNVGKVMVEYKKEEVNGISLGQSETIYKPKLTKDNEVIISLEEKSYTRNEVEEFIKNAYSYGYSDRDKDIGFGSNIPYSLEQLNH